MEREKLKSRLGFILLSAGCAIGIGNVWKFPYMAGQGGGGAFVLFYLLFLVILGLPIMTMEFAVGRASHKSPVRAYQALEKPGQKWHIHGYFTLVGCYLLMMFYTTVAGWMLHYFYMTAAGKLVGLDADQVAGKFTEMLASPLTMGFWMVVVVAIGIFVCARGLQNGLEKVTKVMMIALLVIMVVLAVNSMFMPGAKEGMTFFLVPDFERMKEVGIVNTLVGAMNQAFFTLSLGIGAMAISGSFIVLLHLCGVTAFTSNLLGSLVMNLSAGAARTNYPVLYLLGLAQIAVYFVVFTALIKALDLPTPGRRPEEPVRPEAAPLDDAGVEKLIAALGGRENICTVDNCFTRLRVTVQDAAFVREQALRELPCSGVVQNGCNVQIVFGIRAPQVRQAVEQRLDRVVC